MCIHPPTQYSSPISEVRKRDTLTCGDYCFPKHSGDIETLTTLVIRVYPYKLFFVCVVPVKGRDPRIVQRLERFIKECGLVHFTFRSDREPSIVAMLEEVCALAGRRGIHDPAPLSETTIPEPPVTHGDVVTLEGSLEMEPIFYDEPNTPKTEDMPSSQTALLR